MIYVNFEMFCLVSNMIPVQETKEYVCCCSCHCCFVCLSYFVDKLSWEVSSLDFFRKGWFLFLVCVSVFCLGVFTEIMVYVLQPNCFLSLRWGNFKIILLVLQMFNYANCLFLSFTESGLGQSCQAGNDNSCSVQYSQCSRFSPYVCECQSGYTQSGSFCILDSGKSFSWHWCLVAKATVL